MVVDRVDRVFPASRSGQGGQGVPIHLHAGAYAGREPENPVHPVPSVLEARSVSATGPQNPPPPKGAQSWGIDINEILDAGTMPVRLGPEVQAVPRRRPTSSPVKRKQAPRTTTKATTKA